MNDKEVYLHSREYAILHGESELYRANRLQTPACADAIDAAIHASNFEPNRYEP